MIYNLLAHSVLLFHFFFILFVTLGGLLTLKWKRAALIHVPLLLWGILIEYMGWICPLTPLENRLMAKGGATGYGGGFIEQYLLPLIYPGELTREIQILLGTVLLLINIFVYFMVWQWGIKKNGAEEGADS